jgi:hypothetical protein
MKLASTALRTPFGVISPVLVGFTGFAAGALLMALVAFQPAPKAAESPRIPVSSSARHDAVRLEGISIYTPERAAPAGPWPFESATLASARAPGKARADRLSAPEGWTYEAAASSD